MNAQGIAPSLYGLVLGLTLGWGLNWPIMKLVLDRMPVWSFRAVSVLLGAVGLIVVARAAGHRLWPLRSEWPALWWTALFNVTLWNLLIGFGLTLVPAGRAAILAYTMPIWTLLLSAVFLGESLNRRRMLGLVFAALALYLLLREDIAALQAAPMGSLLVIGGALAWAIGTILIKRMPIGMPLTSFTAWQFILGDVPLIIGAVVTDSGQWRALDAVGIGAVLYNTVVAFVFCHWAWFRIVQQAPAGIASLSTMLIPVLGVLSSMVALGDRPGPAELTALALVVAALATVLSRPGAISAARD
ncbi:MAG: DMT family transporter [Betaproteobacteria bacterium]|nr:DMT family transporter [Betaproteobacteria bacterium]